MHPTRHAPTNRHASPGTTRFASLLRRSTARRRANSGWGLRKRPPCSCPVRGPRVCIPPHSTARPGLARSRQRGTACVSSMPAFCPSLRKNPSLRQIGALSLQRTPMPPLRLSTTQLLRVLDLMSSRKIRPFALPSSPPAPPSRWREGGARPQPVLLPPLHRLPSGKRSAPHCCEFSKSR